MVISQSVSSRGTTLSAPYLFSRTEHGALLALPSLFLLPGIGLVFCARTLSNGSTLPFLPGTALSPNRSAVMALRGVAGIGGVLAALGFLNAWLRQSPKHGWDVVEDNRWAGAAFIADLSAMSFAALYVAVREEWRWRVIIVTWPALL